MYSEEKEISGILESAGINASPDPVQMYAVRERMLSMERGRPVGHRRRRTIVISSGLLVACAAAGIAATETGRNLVMSFFTPVTPSHAITGQNPDGNPWVISRTGTNAKPFTPAEEQAQRNEMNEVYAIKQAGGGRLVRLFEAPGFNPGETMTTFFKVEYKLSNGSTTSIGEGKLTEKQIANTRADEILKLRDEGAGELTWHKAGTIGLGDYRIRFTLSDGSTVDIMTNYPVGPRSEREAIFAETRTLKEQRKFAVDHATPAPGGQMYGLLRYKLADGRMVGISESVPADMVTADGTQVVTQEQEEKEVPQISNEDSLWDRLKKGLGQN